MSHFRAYFLICTLITVGAIANLVRLYTDLETGFINGGAGALAAWTCVMQMLFIRRKESALLRRKLTDWHTGTATIVEAKIVGTDGSDSPSLANPIGAGNEEGKK